MTSGIINVYKDAGFTSFDVVAKLRGMLHIKKIGHTGTLDPDATGVLPICIGKATKVVDLITDKDKTYVCSMLLGVTTDTEDISGQVLSETEVNLSEEEVYNAVMSFVGEYDQVPPMYSALKVDGRKLYEYARAGQQVERQSRRVEIYDIEIHDICLPIVYFTIKCSKGTYIRSLCRDIGDKLGCGACMEQLMRSKVGTFEVADSLTLGQLQMILERGQIDEVIMPIDQAFDGCSRGIVRDESLRYALNGGALELDEVITESISAEEGETTGSVSENLSTERILLYTSGNKFIGTYKFNGEIYKLEKLFYEQDD